MEVRRILYTPVLGGGKLDHESDIWPNVYIAQRIGQVLRNIFCFHVKGGATFSRDDGPGGGRGCSCVPALKMLRTCTY